MKNKIYFITGNKNKFEEAKAIIPNLEQLDIDLTEIQEIDEHKIIKHKLREALKHLSGEFIIEDGAFYLDCLNGLPGPFIKWFLKTLGNRGMFDIAKKYNNFNARAKVIIGYAKDTKTIKYFDGEIKGTVVYPRVESGFGWDDIFIPDGYKKTFSEMGKKEKNKISMRKIALQKLKNYLTEEK